MGTWNGGLQFDGSGNVQVSFGPSGVLPVANGGRGMAISTPYRPKNIIPLGDSITLSADAAVGTNSLNWQYAPGATGVITSGILLSGPAYKLVRNAGIAGQTSTQIAARMQSDVLAYLSPGDACVLTMGTNDLPAINSNFNTGVTTLMNNLQSSVVACLAAGVLPVICTVPPNNTYPDLAGGVQWFYYDLARSWGVPLFDLFRALVDPATSGSYASGYSGDGVHPQRAGVAVAAPLLGSFLQNLGACPPYKCYTYLSAMGTTGTEANLLKNGNFTSVTSGLPNFWGAPGGVGSDAVATALTPYSGNKYTRTITSGAQYLLSSGNSAAFTAGDILLLSGAMNQNVASYSAGGTQLRLAGDAGAWAGIGTLAGGQNGLQDFCLPVTADAAWAGNCHVETYSGGDAGTVAFQNLTVINATRLRAIWSPTYPEALN
jgi:lysophospholipase L1-like esterase